MNVPVPAQVRLRDSVTEVVAADTGCVVVTGSHGGRSAAVYARRIPARLYVFNDAGIGKDEAGVAALPLLAGDGIAAVTVAHASARIGDACDSWESGVISRVNQTAADTGLIAGELLRDAVQRLLERD